jgi:perosamine synthetase
MSRAVAAPVGDRIPVAGPWITQREVDYVTDAVTNAWFSNANTYNERFERAFAQHTGRRHAISLPSCTAGLHLILAALGIGPGDEVIIPDATWIASSAPISYVGATPVFADVDPDSWCLDSASLERRITPRTKAVIVVDLYGNMPDMAAIADVCGRHGVALIEDAAEAVGSSFGGRPAGSFGVASAFSFHGSKTLTTGEGGMLLLDDDDLHARCQFLRDHGRPIGDRTFRNTEVAFKYKMTSMQAALGLAQLERVDELVERKREIFSWYANELRGEPGVALNAEAGGVVNTYWMVTVVLDASMRIDKLDLMEALGRRDVDSRPFFFPLSSLEAYRDLPQPAACREANPVSYDISPRALNLPSGFDLTPERVGRVCDALRDAIGELRAA